jgi:sensor histidine kinase YesM
MDQSKEIFASLHENKEYLESYLEMEKLRFDNSFTFQILVDEDIEEDDEDIMIPTLMIQPLAENAIWHGLLHLKGEKKLSIRFSRQENAIICSIEDNGIGILESERLKQFNKTPHKSVGLDNLRNRIKVMNEKYNARCELRITDLGSTDKNRTGTRVVLSFNVITALSYS